MIKYLNFKNHKALINARMNELGNINIICGKNNSGKTTILEALLDNKCYGIGKKPDSSDWLVELFTPQANGWSNPDPRHSTNWFRKYIDGLIQTETIWFSDDLENITKNILESKSNDAYLRLHSKDIFKFDNILNSFFSKSIQFFNPILIPPKRQIDFQSAINLSAEITPSGSGVINKLFFLKNQDIESDDYNTYKKVYDTFYDITGSKFNVVPDKNNQIKLFYSANKRWIPASDSGLGLSDVLIMVSMFNLVEANVFLLEEPENHLHATYQKRLLRYISSLKSKQFFITTHSSVFLNTNMVDKIFYCENNGQILLSDQTSKSEIIDSLGYSVTENLVADIIVLLEGPTDIPVIKEMLKWFEIDEIHNIKFWPLGGDIMASLDLSVFAERNNVFALIDSDPGSSVQRTRFAANCAQNGIYCKKLKRYSLENYFPLEAIRKVFPEQIPDELESISASESVDVQVGFKEKDKTIKTKNAEIVKHMGIRDIEGTDIYGFLEDIKSFLYKINTPIGEISQ